MIRLLRIRILKALLLILVNFHIHNVASQYLNNSNRFSLSIYCKQHTVKAIEWRQEIVYDPYYGQWVYRIHEVEVDKPIANNK